MGKRYEGTTGPDLSNIATELYEASVAGLRAKNKVVPNKKDYMRGVRDTLNALRTWQAAGIDPATLSGFMCELEKQAKAAL